MQSTQNQPLSPWADGTSSPAAILRHAAIYLVCYGWSTSTFYAPGPDAAYPAACVAGAIRCAVFGYPVYDHMELVGDDEWDSKATRIHSAEALLADEVDPEWRCVDGHGCHFLTSCSLEVISDWNDFEGRTLSDVFTALCSAADEWDRLHPNQVSGVRS
jgi:hypothetical protein